MRWRILGFYWVLFSGNVCSPVLSAPSPELPPLFQEFCFDCHGDGSKKGGVSFDHAAFASPEDQRKFWFDVWRNLDAELMPPSDKPRPTPEQRATLQAWVEANPLHLNPAQPDPGRVTIRRLNREEYRNSIRDLTGVDYPVQEHFPPDDTGYGFDTIGDVLNLSPIHLEKYLAAAKEIVASALTPANSLRVHLVPEGSPQCWPRPGFCFAPKCKPQRKGLAKMRRLTSSRWPLGCLIFCGVRCPIWSYGVWRRRVSCVVSGRRS